MSETEPASDGYGVRHTAGRLVRDWRLVQFLGRGAFGEVWSAEWASRLPPRPGIPRRAALKLIHAPATYIEAIESEIVAARDLHHEALIEMYDWWSESTEEAVLVQELGEKSLRVHVETAGALSGDAAANFVANVVAGVRHLHDQKPQLVHLDLHPGNVIYADGLWKTADFGLCRQVPGPYSEVAAYNVALRPPEALRLPFGQQPRVNASWDVWALGLILHYGLTGRDPFIATTPLDRDIALASGDITLDERLSKPFQRLIGLALYEEPAGRPATARSLWSTWVWGNDMTKRAASVQPRVGKLNLDDAFLAGVGLSELDQDRRVAILNSILKRLNLQTGMLIIQHLPPRQRREYHNAQPEEKLDLLKRDVPDYPHFITALTESLAERLRSRAAEIISGKVAIDAW